MDMQPFCMDKRLEENEEFFDFFSDYYEAEAEAELRRQISETKHVILDERDGFKVALGDKEYVDRVYGEFLKRSND